jgi:hypothetical protein
MIKYDEDKTTGSLVYECDDKTSTGGVVNCYTDFVNEDHSMKLETVEVKHEG